MRAVHEGRVVGGRYRLERVLSEGGMGFIVRALDLETRTHVAMKFVHDALLHTTSVRRLFREARVARRLTSRHVVRVLDVAEPDERDPYLVMELLEGEDLYTIVRRGPVAPLTAAAWVIQACDAMADAHAHRIVHRDLTPRNLFLTHDPDGAPLLKVLDFGLSKVLDADHGANSEPELTMAGSLVGSIEYASPEQIQASRSIDTRTDVWALGTVLYHLLTGRSAFAGDSIVRIFNAVVSEEPAPLGDGVPSALADVVMGCLVKDMARRTPDVQTLAERLRPFARAR